MALKGRYNTLGIYHFHRVRSLIVQIASRLILSLIKAHLVSNVTDIQELLRYILIRIEGILLDRCGGTVAVKMNVGSLGEKQTDRDVVCRYVLEVSKFTETRLNYWKMKAFYKH